MALNPDDRLDCGTDLDDVWASIDQPPDAHQRDCPHCAEARANLRPLADLTEQYRGQQDTDPDLQPDAGLTDRILQIAHTEVRRGRRLPLSLPGPDDGLSVSEQAVASVSRRAADGVPGIQVRRCKVALLPTQESPTSAVGPGEGAAVTVALRVSIASTSSVPRLTPSLRTAVTRAVQEQVGMTVTRIDIAVEDVHDA